MKRFYLIGFVLLMGFDTLAQLSFKLAGDTALPLEWSGAWLARVFGEPWIYGAFIGYIGSFFSWMTLLKHAPIGPAFAASYLEIVAVLAVSAWVFNEAIGWPQIAGAVFIIAGIACLAISETAQADAPVAHSRAGAPGAGSAAASAAQLVETELPH